jgi:hypothetical protein
LFNPGPNPVWSGKRCHKIVALSYSYAIFDNCISSLSNAPYWCTKLSYDFDAHDFYGPGLVFYELASGPGVIDTATGSWEYTPTVDDAGGTLLLSVVAWTDLCYDGSYLIAGDTCTVQLSIAPNAPPHFIEGHPSSFVATTGETLAISIPVEDADTCTDYQYYYYLTQNDPEPPGYFDSSTGVLYYYGTSADTGLYYINLVVTEGSSADTTSYYIFHYETYTCGDMNHNSMVNVADVTWLIDFLFRNGPPPVTYPAGDVNCDSGVNVADLTYLVDFLFRSGRSPCADCP